MERKAPRAPRKTARTKPVPKTDVSLALATLSANLQAIVSRDPLIKSQRQLAHKAGVDQKTVNRTINLQNEPTFEQLSKLAAAVGMHPWQLLVPNLDPKNPPVIAKEPRNIQKLYDNLARTREAIDGTLREAGNTDPAALTDP